jgi:arylsulfatase A-like enzyme
VFRRVAAAQALLFGVLYLASVAVFALGNGGVPEQFVALVKGPYLGTAVRVQLSLLPGYVFLAVVSTLLTFPWVQPRRVFLQVLALDGALAVFALGHALKAQPGLFDTVARKLPGVDLYLLHRIHLLDVMSAWFGLIIVITVAKALRGASWKVIAAVTVAFLLQAGASLHRPTPPRATPLSQPNVLILATDSLRFDRLGVHGAARPTPHLDAFASQAIDFTNLHVATASTLEAWVTLFTSQYPATHGIRSMYPSKEEVLAVEAQPTTLPRVFARAGYDTFVSSDWAGNCFDLVDLGFQKRRVGSVQNVEALLLEASMKAHAVVPLYVPGFFIPSRSSLPSLAKPEVLVDQLLADVDDSVRAKKPFFGVLFTSMTHLPYNARYPFNVKYAAPGYDGPHRYQVEVSAHELITTGFAPTLSPEAIQHVRDLYDGAVSDFDDTVGRVLRELDERGLLENTIVIVTTDHGEDLYDPGSTLGHGTNFFGGDQSTRIPFLMRVPGRAAENVSELSRTIDVAPTLLRTVGLEVPGAMQGVDVLTDRSPDRVALAETCYLFFPKSKAMTSLTEAERAEVIELSGAGDTLEVDPSFRDNLVLKPEVRAKVIAAKDRMVRTSKWKLIEIPGKTRPIRRLYDLEADPLQQRNLAGSGLLIEEELAKALR